MKTVGRHESEELQAVAMINEMLNKNSTLTDLSLFGWKKQCEGDEIDELIEFSEQE